MVNKTKNGNDDGGSKKESQPIIIDLDLDRMSSTSSDCCEIIEVEHRDNTSDTLSWTCLKPNKLSRPRSTSLIVISSSSSETEFEEEIEELGKVPEANCDKRSHAATGNQPVSDGTCNGAPHMSGNSALAEEKELMEVSTEERNVKEELENVDDASNKNNHGSQGVSELDAPRSQPATASNTHVTSGEEFIQEIFALLDKSVQDELNNSYRSYEDDYSETETENSDDVAEDVNVEDDDNFDKNNRDTNSREKTPSPKPSTSKNCIILGKRRRRLSIDNNSTDSRDSTSKRAPVRKKKRLRFSAPEVSQSQNSIKATSRKTVKKENNSASSESDDLFIPIMRTRSKSKVISSQQSQSESVLSKKGKNKKSKKNDEVTRDDSDDDDEGPNDNPKRKCRKNRKNSLISSSDSDLDSGDGDTSLNFNLLKRKETTRRRRIRKAESDNSEADSGANSKDDDNPPKRKEKRKLLRSRIRAPANEEDSGSEESTKEAEKRKKKVSKSKKVEQRRSTRLSTKKIEKDAAFDRLIKLRNEKMNKPKRATPPPDPSAKKVSSESEEESSSSGWSPCPVVSDASDIASNFSGSTSTPSSSSVTSGAGTDEEPDLGSGSEGEQDLAPESSQSNKKLSENDDDDEQEEDKEPASSSSDDGEPDDGQNDQRCDLCKNLGEADFEGRTKFRGKPELWCKCGECKMFCNYVGDYDLVCCREIKTVVAFLDDELEEENVCVTKHPRFQFDVLKNEGYARSVSKHREAKRRQGGGCGDFWENYTCGKADQKLADRVKLKFLTASDSEKMWKSCTSYLCWIFDDLEGERMVIPACVKSKIYEKFNVSRSYIRSFRMKTVCPTGHHCRLAFDRDLEAPPPPQGPL